MEKEREKERKRERERERERAVSHFQVTLVYILMYVGVAWGMRLSKYCSSYILPQSLYCAISGVCIVIYVYGMLYILWFYVT